MNPSNCELDDETYDNIRNCLEYVARSQNCQHSVKDESNSLVFRLFPWLIIGLQVALANYFWNDYQCIKEILKIKREEYKLAREERRNLECRLQEVEFREGKTNKSLVTWNQTPKSDNKTTIKKRLLCEIQRLHSNINRNEAEVKNLKTQKMQLLEDLNEANSVLENSKNTYKLTNNDNYNNMNYTDQFDNLYGPEDNNVYEEYGARCMCGAKNKTKCDCFH